MLSWLCSSRDLRVSWHPPTLTAPPARRLHPNGAQEQELLQREIAATDQAINKLVYELYGLTEEEIKTVEAGERD
jgi:hypothetical protein